eukprot:CAMPEP_0181082820 /NCGR_PEP_ID=MMETSP1071-20121207/3825_1 /TAXON_ID=35127 /ORGANISM="Thalassiosira sp., Strain NH16" /LENGTH=489 /DNA_ID=CAMNT_0023164431 /DNA_START=39 /DNA_END=1508 /DNA_ORIENTATION=+
MSHMRREMEDMREEMKMMRRDVTVLSEKFDMENTNFRRQKDEESSVREQMDRRFGDMDDHLKYHEALLKNQKWKYEDLPVYYDDPSDHPFFATIKDLTCDMRYGRADGTIELINHDGSRYDDDDEHFQSHWKQFTDALEEYQYALKCMPDEKDTRLNIYHLELTPSVLELLDDALRQTHFKKFCLLCGRGWVGNLALDGINFAISYLDRNPILKELDLSHNNLSEDDHVSQLCDVIKAHPSVESIQLHGCFAREGTLNGFDVLCSLLTAGEINVKNIVFSGNDVSTGGNRFISDFLATNSALEILNLSRNRLDDGDATLIAGALKINTKLRLLDIRSNSIQTQGLNALKVALFDGTSLSSAADSNHTCYIDIERIDDHTNSLVQTGVINFPLDADEYDNPDTQYAPKACRQKKIYSLLSMRNRDCSNAHYLDEVPVEIMPEMLIAIQEYARHCDVDVDVKALSIVFEIMRRWDKALSICESSISDGCGM